MTGSPLQHADLYHTGVVVEDVERAKAELHSLLGVTWGPGGEAEIPVIVEDGPRMIRFTYWYSAEGPHHLEVIGAIPGTLWGVTAPGRAHHVGYWADDVPAVSAALTARGAPRVAKLLTDDEDVPATIVMHRTNSGLYLEVVDRSMRDLIFGSSA